MKHTMPSHRWGHLAPNIRHARPPEPDDSRPRAGSDQKTRAPVPPDALPRKFEPRPLGPLALIYRSRSRRSHDRGVDHPPAQDEPEGSHRAPPRVAPARSGAPEPARGTETWAHAFACRGSRVSSARLPLLPRRALRVWKGKESSGKAHMSRTCLPHRLQVGILPRCCWLASPVTLVSSGSGR